MSNTVLHHGDCLEIMPNIPDGSIDLTVTSPPYDNLRTYNDSLDWGEHIWKPVINELYRLTTKGGIVVWVVNDATIKGSETGTSFRQALYFMEAGFRLHDTMIWEKQTFTDTGSLRVRYGGVFEYMFVFSNGTPRVFNPLKDRLNKCPGKKKRGTIRQPDGSTKIQSSIGRRSGKWGQRFNLWKINTEVSNTNRCHPAQFPEPLARDHIISWSNPGDIVLDPFLGSGTTGVVCLNLEREFIGIEQDAEYFGIAKARISEGASKK